MPKQNAESYISHCKTSTLYCFTSEGVVVLGVLFCFCVF